MNNAAMNVIVQISEYLLSILLGYRLRDGRSGVLQSMGLQRVGRDLVTEQQQPHRLRSGIAGLYNNSMFNF